MAEYFLAACALQDASRCATAVLRSFLVAASADKPVARMAAAIAIAVAVFFMGVPPVPPSINPGNDTAVPKFFLTSRSVGTGIRFDNSASSPGRSNCYRDARPPAARGALKAERSCMWSCRARADDLADP